MRRLQEIAEEVLKYNPRADVNAIKEAYQFSEIVHQGQQRLSGDPFFSHPLEVAGLLVDLKMDVTTIVAGLLHDVIEDTKASYDEIKENFGEEVADLVDGVTKIGKITFGSKEERQAENFRKMIVAMARDIRILIIKLADRLHNMRTLEFVARTKQKQIAQETLDIYAPLAHRLGMAKIKAELEDLALRYLQPEIYNELVKRVAKRRLEREAEINEVIDILNKKMKEVGVEAQITGRPKHFYSIYKKMHDQNRNFEEIYDLTAVRVINNTIKDCYGALGVIHSLWKPVPGRFKDFIAMPKSNMYRSLHTTVVGPKGDPVEIQIRTWEMHRIAEEGIAAHYLYKEKKTERDTFEQIFAWLRQLIESQHDFKDAREFMETVKVDLFPEEVYIFTPKGDVKSLPEGSTPIDFAYSIHTDIGHRCVGAKVNGKLVPLRYKLRQGDIVEILTSPTHVPSRDWLKVAKSSRARSKIRQWLKIEEKNRSLSLGKEIFEKESKKYNLNTLGLLKSDELKKIASDLGFSTTDDLLGSVGYGKVSIHQIFSKLLPPDKIEKLPEEELKLTRAPKHLTKSDTGIKIKGIEDVLVRFAKCCNPLPGDRIVGFITRGRGITIHTRDCPGFLENPDSDRTIDVEWDMRDKISHPVKIAVHIGKDRPGLLAEISSAISSVDANIIKADIMVTEDKRGLNHFVIEITDLDHLQRVIASIQKIKDIIEVERLRTL